jgi:hypothetical protein
MAHRWKLRNCESCNARTCLSDICINCHMIKHRKLVKSHRYKQRLPIEKYILDGLVE